MNERLERAFRKLRLSGLAQTLDVRLEEATRNQLTHTEFLELILQDELAVRGERLIQRRTKAAAFRGLKTLVSGLSDATVIRPATEKPSGTTLCPALFSAFRVPRSGMNGW